MPIVTISPLSSTRLFTFLNQPRNPFSKEGTRKSMTLFTLRSILTGHISMTPCLRSMVVLMSLSMQAPTTNRTVPSLCMSGCVTFKLYRRTITHSGLRPARSTMCPMATLIQLWVATIAQTPGLHSWLCPRPGISFPPLICPQLEHF